MNPSQILSFNKVNDVTHIAKIKMPYFTKNNLHINANDKWLFTKILLNEIPKDLSNNIHFEGNVLFLPLGGRYYHDFVEIFPQILTLKKINEDFKVVFFCISDEAAVTHSEYAPPHFTKIIDGIYDSMHKNYKGMTFKYMKDILDNFEIKFQCLVWEEGMTFSSDASYMFYYDRDSFGAQGIDPAIETIFQNEKISKEYIYHSYLVTGLSNLQTFYSYKTILEMFPKNKTIKNKKIFIGRKQHVFIDRLIENYNELEAFFNSLGYETIYLEDYDLFDQIKICQESDFICSLAGSSFINSLMANKNTKLLKIHTGDQINFTAYTYVASKLELDMKEIYCEPDGIKIINYLKNNNSEFIKIFLREENYGK